jgi:hypothetical protein
MSNIKNELHILIRQLDVHDNSIMDSFIDDLIKGFSYKIKKIILKPQIMYAIHRIKKKHDPFTNTCVDDADLIINTLKKGDITKYDYVKLLQILTKHVY